jgi:Na+-transporting methylmalonyl-CoA/oxaloacetate decarboxylase gamma subunit
MAASIKFLLILVTAAWCVGSLSKRLFPRPSHG